MATLLPAGIPRYLRTLSSHFAKGAQAMPVVQVLDSVDGGALTLADFTLTLTPGPGSLATALALDLRGQTLTTLLARITAHGYRTTTLDPALAAVSATILADVPATSFAGGVTLAIATNPLWMLFNPVAQIGEALRADAVAGVAQIDLRLAAGRWLDQLAALYGTYRANGETDALLRARIDYHVIRPQTTVPSLTHLIATVAGVTVTVTDGPIDYFRCGQHTSRTLTRTQRTPRLLPPGVRPLITVTLHETLPPDTAPYPIADEIGARFNAHCWSKSSLSQTMPLRTRSSGEGAMRLPGGARAPARLFPDPSFRTMVPQRASRALWELIDTYKAAGVAHVLRLPQVIALSDRSPDELALQNGALGQGQNSVPATGYVRVARITQYLPATPATSRVGQAVVTTNVITGPLRVTKTITTSVRVAGRVGRAMPTTTFIAINQLVATTTLWPREHPVVRKGVWTTTTVLQRVLSRES